MALLHAFDRSRLFEHVGGGATDAEQLGVTIGPEVPAIIGHPSNEGGPTPQALDIIGGDCAIAAENT